MESEDLGQWSVGEDKWAGAIGHQIQGLVREPVDRDGTGRKGCTDLIDWRELDFVVGSFAG